MTSWSPCMATTASFWRHPKLEPHYLYFEPLAAAAARKAPAPAHP